MGVKKLTPDKRTAATLKNLGEWNATRDEAASWLGVTRQTLWKFLDEFPDMQEAFENGLNTGKTTLRRLQWKLARQGNATMLIWLGKQLLKQYDQPLREEDVTREDIEALRVEIERKLARVTEADEAERVASKLKSE